MEVKHAGGEVHQGPGAGEGRGGEPRLPDPPHARVPRRGGGRAPAGERHLADADEKHPREPGPAHAALNFIAAPREAVDRILEQDKLTRLSLLPGSGSRPRPGPQGHREAGRRARRAGLPDRGAARGAAAAHGACCTCWPRATPWPRPWTVTFAEAASYARFIAKVDQTPVRASAPGAASSRWTR